MIRIVFYFSKIERVTANYRHIYAANIKVRSIFLERDLTGVCFSGCQGASASIMETGLFYSSKTIFRNRWLNRVYF
ncbi:hypothetical protein B4110_2476 [Parageobacillus toebii]|uniref:Uncharacterized protein n=1 Tax=Parageobacillus toebii TaxID=153151 RepID=A0A150MMV9_9BACL|nr:hypothetical protein B4110_2476 [Parageobacillus toebii]